MTHQTSGARYANPFPSYQEQLCGSRVATDQCLIPLSTLMQVTPSNGVCSWPTNLSLSFSLSLVVAPCLYLPICVGCIGIQFELLCRKDVRQYTLRIDCTGLSSTLRTGLDGLDFSLASLCPPLHRLMHFIHIPI